MSQGWQIFLDTGEQCGQGRRLTPASGFPRRYEDATAAEDLRRLFDFLDFMIRAERAFGFTDGEGLYENMQENRLLLSSVINEKSTFRMLQNQLKQNSEAVNLEFARRYQIFSSFEKDCLATSYSSPLTLGCTRTSFPRKILTLPSRNMLLPSKLGIPPVLRPCSPRLQSRMSNPKLSFDAMNDFVKGVPWTLAVYKRGLSGETSRRKGFFAVEPASIKIKNFKL